MNEDFIQTLLVILIVGIAVILAVRHFFRQLTGKESGCNSCPHSGGTCHCQKDDACPHCENRTA